MRFDLNTDIKRQDGRWLLRWYNKKDGFVQTRIGKLHNNVSQRVRRQRGVYQGSTIHPDFGDPQAFGDWCVAQPGWGLGYHLDKDLLIPGNMEYGPATCCFLPGVVNTNIRHPEKFTNIRSRRDGWLVVFWRGAEKVVVSHLASKEEAMTTYARLREARVSDLADAFRSTISTAAFDALKQWRLKVV